MTSIILFVVLSGKATSSSSFNNTKVETDEVIRILETTSRILKEEQKRWEHIHNNPGDDKYSLIEYEDKFQVRIEIIQNIQNEVNHQNITRTYTFDKGPSQNTGLLSGIYQDFDLYLLASIGIQSGVYPAVSLGYHPIVFQGIGFGGYVSTEGIGSIIFYDFPEYKRRNIIIGISIGYNMKRTSSELSLFAGVRI